MGDEKRAPEEWHQLSNISVARLWVQGKNGTCFVIVFVFVFAFRGGGCDEGAKRRS